MDNMILDVLVRKVCNHDRKINVEALLINLG